MCAEIIFLKYNSNACVQEVHCVSTSFLITVIDLSFLIKFLDP